MKVFIYHQNIDLLENQRLSIEHKMLMLDKFTKRFGDQADLDIFITKATNRHSQGNIFIAEAKFKIPGKDIFCKEMGGTLDEAIDRLKDRLKRLLIENKEAKYTKWRRLIKFLHK